jgi:hypothetical protein
VLSGPRNLRQTLAYLFALRLTLHSGFIVPTLQAIEILEKSNPSAANWWRQNAAHLLRARRYLVFPTDCCERVE